MKIAIIHPDLGIGGAERLIVDIGLALKSAGHEVLFHTSYHNRNHCFPETKDGTLDVKVIGEWIPRCIFGRFHAALAYLKMMYVAFYVVLNEATDLVICDQVSACIPVLKLKNIKVIFYGHFPDQLLTDRRNWLKKLYRFPLDWLEEKTTGMADVVIVNSEFTGSMFRKTFQSLADVQLQVLYPTIHQQLPVGANVNETTEQDQLYFLSINRYERKKNIELSIYAMAKLKDILPSDSVKKFQLIIAGGYDERLAENRDYYSELKDVAISCDIENEIMFLKSPDDDRKRQLIQNAIAVLYTPQNEHFGIVPLEAMASSTPVIACNSGGPLETVVDGATGFLCEPNPEAFADKMKLLCYDQQLSTQLGKAGAKHIQQKFSFSAFAKHLNDIVSKLI